MRGLLGSRRGPIGKSREILIDKEGKREKENRREDHKD